MIVRIGLRKVDAIAWHLWLDSNDPSWSVVKVHWNQDITGSLTETRESVEWLANQFNVWQNLSDSDIIVDYELSSEDIVILARLSWVINVVSSHEDEPQ